MQDNLGRVLKEWRQIRRVSQMDLSMLAGVSARHISFLETGRSQPTRGMLLRLSEVLNMPPAARNRMLMAAGLAPAPTRRVLSEEELVPLHQAMSWMLQNHAPYPAIALDRHWNLVAANAPAQMLLAPVGLTKGTSLLEAFLDNAPLRGSIVNLPEVERFLCARLRTELMELGNDTVLETALAEFEARVNEQEVTHSIAEDSGVVLATRYRFGEAEMALFSTMSHFSGANDDVFSELKVELMFPADAETGQALRALAAM